MKKLLAMLLALCMMCGVVGVGAEETQTISAMLAKFEIPADWDVTITQDAKHSFVAFLALPDGQEGHISLERLDSRLHSGCTTQYDFFENSNAGIYNATISEGYADLMPDKEPLIICERHSDKYQSHQYFFTHCYSNIVMNARFPVGDNILDTVLAIFASVTNPAIEADKGAKHSITVTGETKIIRQVRPKDYRINIGALSFELLPQYQAYEPIQESEGLIISDLYDHFENSGIIMVLDYKKAGVKLNVLDGDEQIDNLFWMTSIMGVDQETALYICSSAERLHIKEGVASGHDILEYYADTGGLCTYYHEGIGILVAIFSEDGSVANYDCVGNASYILTSVQSVKTYQEQTELSEDAAPEQTIVITDGANIRTAPDGNATKIKTAYAGEVYPLLGEEGTWYKIEVDGQVGYVVKGLAKIK